MVAPWTQMTSEICTSAAVLPPDSLPLMRVITAVERLEELLDRVGGRRPEIRRSASALFDVYLLDDTVVYAKDPCVPEDVDATFFLHVYPIDPDDLPGPRRRAGYAVIDFRFDDLGGILNGGVCAVEVPLPGYGVAAIRTGQFEIVEGGFPRLWEGEIRLGRDGDDVMTAAERLELLDRVGGRSPAIRGAASALFDVYLLDDTLVYAKDPCVPEDVDATFFLHVYPIDPDDLPGPRRRAGYAVIDFRFDDLGGILNGGVCAVEVPLPGYGVAAIRTGQFEIVEGGFPRLWEGEIQLGAGAAR